MDKEVGPTMSGVAQKISSVATLCAFDDVTGLGDEDVV